MKKLKKPRCKFIFRKTAVFGQAKEKELREVRILCGLIESWRDVLCCTGIVRPQEMKKAVYQWCQVARPVFLERYESIKRERAKKRSTVKS